MSIKNSGRRSRGELAPKEAEVLVPIPTLAVLIVNALQGFASKEVGFEDTSVTLEEFLRELERKTRIKVSIRDLEQLLWSANLRSEGGAFWSPRKDESFQQFLQQLFHYVRLDREPLVFDKDYNVISYKYENEGEQ